MKHFFHLVLVNLWLVPGLYAQTEKLIPTVDKAIYFDISPPLRDMIRTAPGATDRSWKEGVVVVPNQFDVDVPGIRQPGSLITPDPVLQNYFGTLLTDTTITNFNGLENSGSVPPDTYGEPGLNYYFQVVNTSYAIYNKSGEKIFGPYPNSSVWNGMPNNANSGDAVVLYDETANRWLFTQFSLPNYPYGPFFQMIAVSQTSDPTGSWYRWQFQFPDMPDYPKFGVWPDGYYMSSNDFGQGTGWIGNGAIAYDRTAMLAGDPDALRISFTLLPGPSGFITLYPSDCDGPFPPLGTPAYFGFIRRNTPQYVGIYEFHADFVNPVNSTFTNTNNLTVAPFDPDLDGIPQLGTNVKLDDITDRLMYRLQFRNFGDHSSMVVNHTVNAGAQVAGIRWYELRKTTGAWSVYQQGTYAPDNHSRWMGSIAMDTAGSIALGYSVSSATMYPSIRYTGRLKTDPLNQMTIAERSIIEGGGSQTGIWGGRSRWGDYSAMSVDPANPTTFWYTQEYYMTTSTSDWSTRIASFTFDDVFSTYASSTPAKLCLGDTVQLDVIAYGGSNAYTYSWTSLPAGFTSAQKDPLVIPADTTTYIVATSDGTQTRYDTTRVEVAYPLEVFAGNDTAICAWVPSLDLHAVAANYRYFIWGSFGDGTFSDMFELETTYFPGPGDRSNGSVDLALLAFAIAPCEGKIVDTLHLVIDPCTGTDEPVSSTMCLMLSPNPAHTQVSVTIIGLTPKKICELVVSGLDGKVRQTERWLPEGSRSEKILDLSAYAQGIYILKFISEERVMTAKLVVR